MNKLAVPEAVNSPKACIKIHSPSSQSIQWIARTNSENSSKFIKLRELSGDSENTLPKIG